MSPSKIASVTMAFRCSSHSICGYKGCRNAPLCAQTHLATQKHWQRKVRSPELS